MAQSLVMKKTQSSSRVAEVTMIFVLVFIFAAEVIGGPPLFALFMMLGVVCLCCIQMTFRLICPREFPGDQPTITLGQAALLLLLFVESIWSYRKLGEGWYRTLLEDLPTVYAFYLIAFPWKRIFQFEDPKKKKGDENQ